MPITVEISSREAPLSPEEEQLIRQTVEGLERYEPRMLHCQAVVDVPHRRPTGEPVAWILRLVLSVPGRDIVINRHAKPTLHDAIDDTRRAAQRRLRDRARSRRPQRVGSGS